MKFTKGWAVFCLLSITALNSCSNLPSVFEAEKTTTQVPSASLTPLQIKVLALQAKPNLYKIQAGKHKFSAAALSQFKGALLLKQQGELSQAREAFLRLSEQQPNLSGVWLQLALVTKMLNRDASEQQLQDIEGYLENALEANPLNYLAHNEMAQLQRQQGQFQESLAHYQLAIKSWPGFAAAYLNRGILYDLYLGEKIQALADYKLYQGLSNDDSRQLKGWIIDLQRQIKAAEQNPQQGTRQ
ncbi:tetratricopeptide repeat protein [uncultured Paraglaciecola sp.]|uniref:tetratricopeptide repeat protein n=1 Tax=uncultured Paraglaciecola sp. TaxID=1765024 RepID=UPI0026271C17|nr:tetratricopeptide repeat protein [uncultured Paraglaciecola sp.]